MNPFALIFFLICAAALIGVPRKWAPVPLLIGCTYMALGQGLHIGPISLPVYRLLLLVGVLRVLMKGEKLPGGLNLCDKMMIAWGVWMVFCSLFHDMSREGPIYASGVVFNQALVYFLIRIWCTDLEEVGDVVLIVALLLVPIAAEMMLEKVIHKNSFSIFGGVPDWVIIREGKYRAQGPFRHPILAGTVGATCFPLFVGILKRHKTGATIGIVASIFIVFASASSGPVMSLFAAIGGLLLWNIKGCVKWLRYGFVALYLVLMATMKQPPYFLISKIDLSGGSTGWHRSFLIQQTLAYFSEWWAVGTDETRHWMPFQGFAMDPHHTDITNYYIGFAVMGGLLGMFLIIGMMTVAFRWVGQIHDSRIADKPADSFMIWCFGACLFSHAVTSISVAYFDQSMLYFWLSVAVISSVYSIVKLNQESGAYGRVPSEFDDDDEPLEVMPTPEEVARANAEWRRKLWERPAPFGITRDPR